MTNDDKLNAMDEILGAMQTITNWSREECRNFLSSLSAETPEQLMDVINEAIEIARLAECTLAGVDLMKRLGRVVDATVHNRELQWRFHPDCMVTEDAAGHRLDIKFKPNAFELKSSSNETFP